MDLESFERILSLECKLDNGLGVVIGVSGGPDSLCLLDLFHRSGRNIFAAHFDHGLRTDSHNDVRKVEIHCQTNGIQFFSGYQDVRMYSQNAHRSIEESARILRYQYLFEVARQTGSAAVAVGHTADDQVETILMHFLRGTGLGGLRGMAVHAINPEWDERIPIIRPIIGMWREEVIRYCHTRALEPVIDVTNQDRTYFRNRIRHELITNLETYNPKIRQSIFQMGQIFTADHEVLDNRVQDLWNNCLINCEKEYVRLNAEMLSGFLPGEQRRLIRKAVQVMRPGLRDVDFSVIERTRKILDKPGGCAQTELVSGLRATLSPGVLTIKESLTEIIPDSIPQVQPGMTSSLDIPGKVGLANGWAITARRGEFTPETPTNCDGDPYCAYLDAEKLELPLLIRGWNTGDRFSPFGMEGHTTKLSDFWINQKIPRVQRKNWPLVLSGKNIAWIPGNRLGEDFRLTQKSHKVVELVCQKE